MTSHRMAGNFLILFAALMLIGPRLDLGWVIVFMIGWSVRNRTRRAVQWGIGFMALYSIVAYLLLFVCIFFPDNFKYSGRRLQLEELPEAAMLIGAIGLCAGLNFVNLVQLRRQQREEVENGAGGG